MDKATSANTKSYAQQEQEGDDEEGHHVQRLMLKKLAGENPWLSTLMGVGFGNGEKREKTVWLEKNSNNNRLCLRTVPFYFS